ncbi:MAG: ketoacyl-ACP synthase III, partial [Balneolaceae bacterium]|nr:ketoacyl-ACP synthase III [Balneolaceae bacterium]
MNNHMYAVVKGTGSYIPTRTITNEDFLNHTFFDSDGKPFERSNKEIIQKLEEITGIKERRYVTDDLLASDIAARAGKQAIDDAGIDPESLDYIIIAHNFGDIRADNLKVDMVPALASRVKAKLEIDNPQCIAYDLPFGCPGWLQGMIQANCFIKSGEASRALI